MTDDDILDGGARRRPDAGQVGNDRLFGGDGRDELQGGAGSDILYGDAGDDHLFGQLGNDQLYGGDGDDYLQGFTASNEAQQSLEPGETDDDRLYRRRGPGHPRGRRGPRLPGRRRRRRPLIGGAGDDTYIQNSVNDLLYEQAGPDAGRDRVYSSTDTLLSANIEELHLIEGFAINGTGNALDNLIVGNAQDNILDGVTGADRMIGGAGNDTYYVDNAGMKSWSASMAKARPKASTPSSPASTTRWATRSKTSCCSTSTSPSTAWSTAAQVLVYGYPKRNELDYMQGDAVSRFLGTCALTSIANLRTQSGRPRARPRWCSWPSTTIGR